MPQKDPELIKKINEARITSFGGEVKISNHDSLPDKVHFITFRDGEIVGVTLFNGSSYKRGMLVTVNDRHANYPAIIIGFQFGGTQMPIQISRGGAEGEMVRCVNFSEVWLLPRQSGKGDVVIIDAKPIAA